MMMIVKLIGMIKMTVLIIVEKTIMIMIVPQVMMMPR